jgi:hypothetical protein
MGKMKHLLALHGFPALSRRAGASGFVNAGGNLRKIAEEAGTV